MPDATPLPMTPDLIWQATLGELRLQLHKPTFDLWLADTIMQAYDPAINEFTIGVPDEHTLDWLQNRLASTIRRTLTGVSGRAASVRFAVSTDEVSDDDAGPDEAETEWAPDWSQLGVPPVFYDESLDTLDWSQSTLQKPELQQYLDDALNFFERGVGLTLIGPPGVGKTHIAVGLLKTAALAGWSAQFVGTVALLDQLRATFDSARQGTFSQSERTILRRLTDTRVLVLDDLRLDGLTVWGRDRLYATLNPRWESRKPTIVTSNYTPDELAQPLGRERLGLDEGTLSRLVRTALTIQLNGPDYRLEQKRRALVEARKQGREPATDNQPHSAG
ncbi:hypothetical protein FJY94_04420 [Candidatus Kaiserbacteria bacterium]|nr:hypothetical protein [Candidatus Kaiserbacteria bacterium]